MKRRALRRFHQRSGRQSIEVRQPWLAWRQGRLSGRELHRLQAELRTFRLQPAVRRPAKPRGRLRLACRTAGISRNRPGFVASLERQPRRNETGSAIERSSNRSAGRMLRSPTLLPAAYDPPVPAAYSALPVDAVRDKPKGSAAQVLSRRPAATNGET